MSNFAFAFGFLMSHEDPDLSGITSIDNNGGKVRYGLNEKSFPSFWIDGPPSLQQIINCIKLNFWEDLDKFSKKVAAKILDIRYNCGLKEGNKILQRALQIQDDGIIGPDTFSAIKSISEINLLIRLSLEQVTYYRSLKEFDIYKNNWLPRGNDIP